MRYIFSVVDMSICCILKQSLIYPVMPGKRAHHLAGFSQKVQLRQQCRQPIDNQCIYIYIYIYIDHMQTICICIYTQLYRQYIYIQIDRQIDRQYIDNVSWCISWRIFLGSSIALLSFAEIPRLQHSWMVRKKGLGYQTSVE